MKSRLIIACCLVTTVGFSQTNLVPNPTFEKIEKKVKLRGEIRAATPWISPTLAKADLYIPKSKNFNISVPANDYGEEKPMEGSGYAGFLAYSYKDKEPRTYLQVKLKSQMVIGEDYCVKYHVSLADLSKYATNHLAAAITDKQLSVNNSNILLVDNAIESKLLTIYEQQYYWTPMCGIYSARGGEQYLTIGNFTPNEDLKTIRVKRPRGFNKPQKYNAYYYIDNVSVTLVEDAKDCNCDVVEGMENVTVVKSGFGSDETKNATNVTIVNTDGSEAGNTSNANAASGGKVDGMKIMFESGAHSISNSTDQLDKIVEHLKTNIDENVKVSGYIDESEKSIDKLAGRRVGAVYKYLISKGIKKERIIRKIVGVGSFGGAKDKTKNMKVTIEMVPN